MKVHLLAIDCQRDFCQAANSVMAKAMLAANNGKTNPDIEFVKNGGALFVAGADQDMIRLGVMINRLVGKIDDIHATLDSHNEIHIAHPIFWVDSKGNHPNPFTLITKDDVVNGVWTTTNPACRQRALDYVTALDTNKRYVLCIWPTHCIISTIGWGMAQPVADALSNWCKKRFKKVDYLTKGSNVFTENYSIVQADVPDPSDPTTMLNTELLKIISTADDILIAGEALSHCVANSVTDIADNFGEENIKKFVLLEDTCSNVGGFDKLGKDFVAAMIKRGMRVEKSTEYLA